MSCLKQSLSKLVGCMALAAVAAAYDVGVGIADMTGPAVEINFMGYGNTQKGEGIHMRQWARAFVVSDGSKRMAFVSMDGCMGSDLLNKRVVENLEKELGEGVYGYDNVCISGTHTHSTPGGFMQYVMVEVPSLGFVHESLDSMVTGVTAAILAAHRSAKPGHIRMSNGLLFDSNINRSPTSYLLNPQAEQDEYKEEGDTDKNMLLLRIDAEDGTPLGMFNWFAVHGTSMNNTNHLISGDNRGYASYLFEKAMNGKDTPPGKGAFVAAFASTNLGDVSPNTAGAKCLDTGLPCDRLHSTCNGREEMCVAFGPGKNGDMFESTEIIGRKQFDHAQKLYEKAKTGAELSGPLDYRHSFVAFGGLPVKLEDGKEVELCTAAIGNSFAGGTTDGCGMFDFTQGENTSNPFWKFVSGLLSKPSKEKVACHAPKPILLNLGNMTFPYSWDAPKLPIQIFRIGQLAIAAPPGELTTMAGRRFRKALKGLFSKSDFMAGQEPVITIAGLSNSYMHYMTTYEEYQAQRYEAASTLFGPHQLSAFLQEFGRLADDMISGRPSTSGSPPEDLTKHQVSFVPGVIFDFAPLGKSFGQALTKPASQYQAGDIVLIKFQSANPRNNRRLQSSFLTVDRQANATSWKTIATDADWETKFRWKDTIGDGLSAESHAYMEWSIPKDVEAGVYRICHYGDRKSISSGFKVKPFEGCSDSFKVGGTAKADILV